MQSGYGVEGDDITAEELDLDGFFEDDIAPQSSHTFTEGAGEAIGDNSAGLDDSGYCKKWPCGFMALHK